MVTMKLRESRRRRHGRQAVGRADEGAECVAARWRAHAARLPLCLLIPTSTAPAFSHPPVAMKTSRKKEPTAEETVSVRHTQAMAWNREVALQKGRAGAERHRAG